MNPPDIIIVNYNSTDYLLNCLRSVQRSMNGMRANIFVQDNASRDRADRILTEFPHVIFTQNRENLGFAKGVNQALKQGRGDYVILLNPDTWLTENFFETAISFMQNNPDVGVTGPKILDIDGKLQNSARSFPTPLTAFFGRSSFLSRIFPKNPITSRNLLSLKSDGKTPMEVGWVSGACMVVRRRAIEKTGLLDERFFMYWEDADWCRRMWDKGWKVIYNPGATIYHHVGGSSERLPIRSNYEFHKSVYYLFNKHNYLLSLILRPVTICALSLRFLMMAMPHTLRYLTDRAFNRKPLTKETEVFATSEKLKPFRFLTDLVKGWASRKIAALKRYMQKRSRSKVLSPRTDLEKNPDESFREQDVTFTMAPSLVPIKSPLVREKFPIKDPDAILRLRRFIAADRHDILRADNSEAIIMRRWTVWLAHAPIIGRGIPGLRFHDRQTTLQRIFYIKSGYILYIKAETQTLPAGNKLVAVKQPDNSIIIACGIESEHLDVIRDQLYKAVGIIPGKTEILTRVSLKKKPLQLIRGIEFSSESVTKACVVVVGDGRGVRMLLAD